ncbi:MAG: hypothetical protein U9N45_06950, partial [Gemmatimonadota bacterium]|nr:hypothetical protein [Gemmatimonadota bacterium]
MKKYRVIFLVFLISVALSTLHAKEYFVSEDGVDAAGRDGSGIQPWRQMQWVLNNSILQSGDTLTVLPGFYQRLSFWNERYFFDPENPILIRSREIHAAHTDGINMGKGTGIIFEGLEVGPGREGQNVVHLMFTDVHDIVIRSFLIHDAAPGGDCLKINSGAHHIIVENGVIYNP